MKSQRKRSFFECSLAVLKFLREKNRGVAMTGVLKRCNLNFSDGKRLLAHLEKKLYIERVRLCKRRVGYVITFDGVQFLSNASKLLEEFESA